MRFQMMRIDFILCVLLMHGRDSIMAAPRGTKALRLHSEVHARPRYRHRAAGGGRRARSVASLVAPPDAGAAGPVRDARAACRGAALPRGHRGRVLVLAPRRNGPRPG